MWLQFHGLVFSSSQAIDNRSKPEVSNLVYLGGHSIESGFRTSASLPSFLLLLLLATRDLAVLPLTQLCHIWLKGGSN